MDKFTKLYLKKSWPLYVLVALVATVASSILVDAFSGVLKTERVNVFIAGEKEGSIKDLQDYATNNRPSYLKEVNIDNYLTTSSYFEIYYSVQGFQNSDILLLPVSTFNNSQSISYITQYCLDLNEEVINNRFGNNFEYYQIELNYTISSYGLKVYDHETNSGILKNALTNIINSNDDYYAFFNKSSSHLLSFDSSLRDDGILDVMEVLSNYAL